LPAQQPGLLGFDYDGPTKTKRWHAPKDTSPRGFGARLLVATWTRSPLGAGFSPRANLWGKARAQGDCKSRPAPGLRDINDDPDTVQTASAIEAVADAEAKAERHRWVSLPASIRVSVSDVRPTKRTFKNR
jgi:hypothetical protein